MQNVNDVFNYPEEWPLHPEISLFDTTYLFPSVDTVNALSKRVEWVKDWDWETKKKAIGNKSKVYPSVNYASPQCN